MNNGTEGVTLLAGFVFDVLQEYRSMKKTCQPAFDMAKGLDPNRQDEWCTMNVYNDVCTWIERHVGESSIRKAGVAIGNRVAENIVKLNKMTSPTPLAMMESLKWAAANMVRDPAGRGWEILAHTPRTITMRRTQTFNCIMQEGLLLSLVERTKVEAPDVEQMTCTRRGDEFCDYRLSWL
jgi:hypothetical protein